jgi:hypothetical protein
MTMRTSALGAALWRNANSLCARPKIESRLKELWWTPPRMIAFALAAGIIIVLLGMGVGAFLVKMLH